jgi:Glycosyl hydrolase family 79 C-terminal beta domain
VGISRRTVLAGAASAPLAMARPAAAATIGIRVAPEHVLRTIPPDFMGLGYEISSVAVPGLLSGDNRTYVRLVRNLGAQGVIRVGGNTSDFSSYDANGTPKSLPKGTVVNQANFRELRSFLDATGWKLIWGLNLGQDNLENAVAEARAIVDAIGPRLLALEIGNEPDLFPRAGHRQGIYDYTTWHAEYRRYKAAIRAALPGVPFAGPDIAGNAAEWVEGFAKDEGGDIALLTAHHYIGGQAQPTSTLETMLAEEKKYQPVTARFRAAAEAAHLPYRICETASYSGGGRPGVSDTFASALWALDYLFVLASAGCGGVNMETGVNHLGFISSYTPIGDDLAGHYSAAPEYYGLLAFTVSGRGELLETACDNAGVNLTAYVTRSDRRTVAVTVINKDQAASADVTITGVGARRARVMRLAAPSLTATSGVTLGGMAVDREGGWRHGQSEPVRINGDQAVLTVPAGSAALVELTV